MAWNGWPLITITPAGASSVCTAALTTAAASPTDRSLEAVTAPSTPTMKATSMPSRWRRFSSADWMVALSWVATAVRKPKSRDSSAASSSSCCVRRDHRRSNTVPLATSSWRVTRAALLVMAP